MFLGLDYTANSPGFPLEFTRIETVCLTFCIYWIYVILWL